MKHVSKLLFATIILCLPLLFGCHGSKMMPKFELPESFDTEKEYEISFWAKNDTNVTQTRIYERAISEFEELYPNITVKLKLYTDYSKIYNDVITNIPTMTTPNVCITYPDHIATYITGDNALVSLDELIDDERYGLGGSELLFESPRRNELIDSFLDECHIDGELYALPFMRSSEACYVNKTYVEKLGYTLPKTLTWDFVFEVAEAAAEKDADGNYLLNSQKVMIPFMYKSTDNMMIQMLAQKGAGYSNDNGDILLFNDTTRELLGDIADSASVGAFSTFKISSYPANFLNAGQCVFAVDSTAGATWMGADAPLSDISEDKLVRFDIEVMSVPQYDADASVMISQGPSVCLFNKQDPDEVLASWLFLQYLLTNDIQIAYAQTEGYVPVTSKAQESEEYLDYLSRAGEDNELYYDVKLKASKLLLDNTDNTFVTPVFNGSASLRSAAGQLIESTVKSVRRGENIDDEYFDELFDEVSSLYRLDEVGAVSSEREELGELPMVSKMLIGVLSFVWVCIIAYALCDILKNRKKA